MSSDNDAGSNSTKLLSRSLASSWRHKLPVFKAPRRVDREAPVIPERLLRGALAVRESGMIMERLQQSFNEAGRQNRALEDQGATIARRHLPEIEDPVARYQEMHDLLRRLGPEELRLDDQIHVSLRRAARLERYLRETRRTYEARWARLQTTLDRLAPERMDALEDVLEEHMTRILQHVDASSGDSSLSSRESSENSSLSRSEAGSEDRSENDAVEPRLRAVRDRYYEADRDLRIAGTDHDAFRNEWGYHWEAYQANIQGVNDPEQRSRLWFEEGRAACRRLQRAEDEWSVAAHDAFRLQIGSTSRHTSIFTEDPEVDEAWYRNERAERLVDPRIALQIGEGKERIQWVEQDRVCEWVERLPAMNFETIDTEEDAFTAGRNFHKPWQRARRRPEDPGPPGPVAGIESSPDPRQLQPAAENRIRGLKRPVFGEGDDYGRSRKQHRRITRYTAIEQEKWRAFPGTADAGLPREAPSSSGFISSVSDSSELVQQPETDYNAPQIESPIEEGVQDLSNDDNEEPAGSATQPQDSAPASGPDILPHAPATAAAGQQKRTRRRNDLSIDMEGGSIITGKRSTRSGEDCNLTRLQRRDLERARQARDAADAARARAPRRRPAAKGKTRPARRR